jgi:hypothetical protein
MATKNKAEPSFPVKKVGKPPKDLNRAEMDKLKNVICRQDDLIAQFQDDLKDHKNTCEVLRDECGQLEEKIESYREIIKTLMEITE